MQIKTEIFLEQIKSELANYLQNYQFHINSDVSIESLLGKTQNPVPYSNHPIKQEKKKLIPTQNNSLDKDPPQQYIHGKFTINIRAGYFCKNFLPNSKNQEVQKCGNQWYNPRTYLEIDYKLKKLDLFQLSQLQNLEFNQSCNNFNSTNHKNDSSLHTLTNFNNKKDHILMEIRAGVYYSNCEVCMKINYDKFRNSYQDVKIIVKNDSIKSASKEFVKSLQYQYFKETYQEEKQIQQKFDQKQQQNTKEISYKDNIKDKTQRDKDEKQRKASRKIDRSRSRSFQQDKFSQSQNDKTSKTDKFAENHPKVYLTRQQYEQNHKKQYEVHNEIQTDQKHSHQYQNQLEQSKHRQVYQLKSHDSDNHRTVLNKVHQNYKLSEIDKYTNTSSMAERIERDLLNLQQNKESRNPNTQSHCKNHSENSFCSYRSNSKSQIK
ncbi:hypothetical protein OXYTRIMIC_356 [Oxytricha trifallax]|uniref:Uncharacterized protein n=1 Tax=Oxytricha trifallax TaxID=1172189 RepID=A0A073HZV6_9SPIT|nr:hypothetical protein OXYTRIMIC_356 [Oxytricha trifallax]